jgi:hypothetical protein
MQAVVAVVYMVVNPQPQVDQVVAEPAAYQQ